MAGERELSVLERIARFWRRPAGDDHPLTAEERDAHRPASAYDEAAREAEDFVGGDFDPDDRRS